MLIFYYSSKIKIIGLTGGIACGKSVISKHAKEKYNIPVIDCDEIARMVVQPNKPAYKKLLQYFGNGILKDDDKKEINREALGKLVFENQKYRQKLNEITHREIFKEIIKQAFFLIFIRKNKLIILDAPLLFETKILKYICFQTLLIFIVDQELQCERLSKRDNINKQLAQQKINAQWSTEKKIKMADISISNDSTIQELKAKFDQEIFLLL